MEFHEIAKPIPMMNPEELGRLKDDIKANGLLEPIVLYEGKILDGRNRYLACIEVGIEPRYINYEGDTPTQYVVSKINRRNLNAGQLAFIALEFKPMLEKEARKRQLSGLKQFESVRALVHEREAGRADTKTGELFGIGGRYVSYAEEVKEKAPELVPQVLSGEMPLTKAIQKIKRKEFNEQIENIDIQNIKEVNGLYDVIVVDPPWPYETKYDPNGRRCASPYPEMSLEQIKMIELPAAEDCILWLWTTHKFMRYSFDILDIWGFRDVAIVTWVKDRIGLGAWLRSQTEYCIMAIKGNPTIRLTNQTTVIYGKQREHSRKPDEFYKMVDSLCFGRKIDWFSREKREGWNQYGNETDKFVE